MEIRYPIRKGKLENMDKNISIIIPSYNSYPNIKQTLVSLIAQNTEVSYEIILVDCSSDNKVKEIANLYDIVQYLYKDKRFNPGEGRNIGAYRAKGELLIFIDSDVSLEQNAVQKAWESFQNGHEVFGGVLELNEKHKPTIASYLEHYYFNHEAQRKRPKSQRNNLSSALMVISKKLFIDKEGFNDIPRAQDTEFTERLRADGVMLAFIPDVIGYQIQDSSLKKVLNKIYIAANNLYLIRYKQNITNFNKLLFIITLPCLSVLRVIRIIFRHFKYQNTRGVLITIGLIPLLLLSGIYWMLGFYKSLIIGSGISQER